MIQPAPIPFAPTDDITFEIVARPMVRVVVAARPNRVSPALPVIVSDYLNGYSLSGDGAATLPPDFVSGFGVLTRFFSGVRLAAS